MNNKSPHILNTSSNLLGFCFIVLTSLKVLNHDEQTFIDDVMIFAALVFMGSSCFSFFSIRSENEKRTRTYEKIADYCFICGQITLFVVIMVIAFEFL